MTAPLEGVRIIDLTAMVSGPLATMMLADQGAEVIKVENPAGGDFTRSAANRQGGLSASYLNNNRNKRSVAIDLKADEGREALWRLIESADVFVQNFRPGVIERMGFGEEAVRAHAAEIIYVSISGYGEQGPYAGRPVYDPLVQGLSGLATVQAGSDQRRPRLVRTILPDKLTGVTAAQAITAALFARTRTGRGEHVRLSMLEATIAFLWSSDMGSQTFVGQELPQQEAASFQDLIYATTDGYITIAVQSDREWQGLVRALERPDWAEDPRFRTAQSRQIHIDARLELTQSMIRHASSEHWLARLDAEGVPCAPVLTRGEMIDHPQVRACDIIHEYDHPQAGRIRQARMPARFSSSEALPLSAAPALGEDTRALLRDSGYDEASLDELARTGVITTPEEPQG
ncbi:MULTISPECIES: CaiB/BaiF CoA transferase family protein [Halomonas]|uniref:Crotonobetainyl-CoA:carnitine CoA-transferase CaiB-like acyl-CoA transferase n=1 Tax=Halomonas ventosae TaxID=229007 RepID=A0A4R6H395_9GAMM|nr:CoA transferase [Halomonas ventosae]TDO02530.1 crotonobetainyl-CoA:carnitine CoA-transferase CaiB-like acyl-CoA transferase [Halomonas ventosae]